MVVLNKMIKEVGEYYGALQVRGHDDRVRFVEVKDPFGVAFEVGVKSC